MKLKFLALAMLIGSSLSAAIIYVPSSGSLVASIYTDFATFALYDVRGASSGLTNGTTPTFILDSTNGTDPNFATLPFGNLALTAISVDMQNFVTLNLSAVNPVINGTVLTMAGTGVIVQDNNGGLTALVGPFTADFVFSNSFAFGGGSILRYELSALNNSASAGVPEPATFLLIGGFLPVLAVLRRRKSL